MTTNDLRVGTGAEPVAAPPGLRSHPDFIKLLIGQTISNLGSSVSSLAIPLLAVVTLDATAFQVGLLNFMQNLAALPLTFFAGVLVDRVRRRRLLIIADLGRAAVVGMIPILALVGRLNIDTLYFCMLAMGILGVLFDLSYVAHTPLLLPESLLISGNSRLELSRNVMSLLGKGIASGAITVIRIPFVITADAVSYLCSAISLIMIRTPEPAPTPSARPGPRQVLREIREGISLLFANRYLRPVALNAAVANFFTQIILTLFVLYFTRDLRIAGSWIGLVFAAGSVGGVAGSTLLSRAVKRFGYGPAFVAGMVLMRAGLVSIGLLRGPRPLLIVGFTLIWFVTLMGLVTSNICLATLRQVVAPNELRGRLNAAFTTLIIGVTPIGALLAGVLGETLGVHTTILTAALLAPLPLVLIALSPIPSMREVTEAAPAQADREH